MTIVTISIKRPGSNPLSECAYVTEPPRGEDVVTRNEALGIPHASCPSPQGHCCDGA